MKKIIRLFTLGALSLLFFHAGAANIDATAAKSKANQFLKQQSHKPSLRSVAMSDLKLAHVQQSSTANGANAYYAFNIVGGGFVIVAGDDRATPILGYSDQGHLDFGKLPENVQALLRGYQEEIEFLQSHPTYKVPTAIHATGGKSVEPLIKSHWGQEMPYNLQCPTYNGQYCVVGCVATAMTQVLHYWQYPTSCNGINSYYCYDLGQTVPALPETSFDYSKMLNSYCHWDWDNSQLVQDTYTDAQAQAVAKLARYCGQAVQMGYSPEGSGAYVFEQLDAMKDFGYSSAEDVSRSGWWGTEYYSTEEWEAMVKEQLDAKHPILYSASDPSAGGHAFVCDGYNADGMLHFNFGWYGTCDGWYASTALNMTHRDGEELHFNSSHEMLINLVPPTYCVVTADGITSSNDLIILGEDMDVMASNVNIMTTYPYINIIFSVCNDKSSRVVNSYASYISLTDYEQGSDLTNSITLPTTLKEGSYSVNIYYYTSMPRTAVLINCDGGQLNVVGHLAKYNAPFKIDDVTAVIQYLLEGSYEILNIDDVTKLINYLLTSED